MISSKLKSLIASRNIVQKDMAVALGISPSRLSNYITGKREPSHMMLIMIAKYLQIDVNYFTHNGFNKSYLDGNVSSLGDAYKQEAPFSTICERNDNNDTISIPLQSMSGKKTDIPYRKMSFPTVLFNGIEEISALKVFICAADNFFDSLKKDDLIIAVRSDATKLENFDKIIIHGRYSKVFYYFQEEQMKLLIDRKSPKNNIKITDDDLSEYFKVLFVVKHY